MMVHDPRRKEQNYEKCLNNSESDDDIDQFSASVVCQIGWGILVARIHPESGMLELETTLRKYISRKEDKDKNRVSHQILQ